MHPDVALPGANRAGRNAQGPSTHSDSEYGMENSFYQRTAYALSDEPVPSCFLTLDDHLRAHLPTTDAGAYHYCLVLAELICARMADVEMYAFLMADARKRHSLAPEDVDHASDIKTASLTRSFLIGYLGAVRALLDFMIWKQ